MTGVWPTSKIWHTRILAAEEGLEPVRVRAPLYVTVFTPKRASARTSIRSRLPTVASRFARSRWRQGRL